MKTKSAAVKRATQQRRDAAKQKRKQKPQLPLTRQMQTRDEFCLENRISRSKYFELKKKGKAPAEVMVDGKVLITNAAAAKWRAELPAVEQVA